MFAANAVRVLFSTVKYPLGLNGKQASISFTAAWIFVISDIVLQSAEFYLALQARS